MRTGDASCGMSAVRVSATLGMSEAAMADAVFEAACKLNEAGATLMPVPVPVTTSASVPGLDTDAAFGVAVPVLLLPPLPLAPPPQAVKRVIKATASAYRLSRTNPKADVLVAKSRLTSEPTLD